MRELIEVFSSHYQWIFSGIGVLIIGGIANYIFRHRAYSSSISQRGGDQTTNVAVGRDVNNDK